MNGKKVIPSEPALRDIRAAVLNYRDTASDRVVAGFLAALEDAYQFVGANAAAGSTRYAGLVDLPGLRSWSRPHRCFAGASWSSRSGRITARFI